MTLQYVLKIYSFEKVPSAASGSNASNASGRFLFTLFAKSVRKNVCASAKIAEDYRNSVLGRFKNGMLSSGLPETLLA
jgi:hypothetical protein